MGSVSAFRSLDTDGIFHQGSGAEAGVGSGETAGAGVGAELGGAIGTDGIAYMGGAARYIACGLGGQAVCE